MEASKRDARKNVILGQNCEEVRWFWMLEYFFHAQDNFKEYMGCV